MWHTHYTHISQHTHIHNNIHTHPYRHTHMIHTTIHTQVHTQCTQLHTHPYRHTYTQHTHTHTHTHTPASKTVLITKIWTFCYSLSTRTDSEAEAPILRTPDTKSQLTGNDPDAGNDWRQEEKEVAEDEMVGWHHWLNGHEFQQTQGDSEVQGSLVCCSS